MRALSLAIIRSATPFLQQQARARRSTTWPWLNQMASTHAPSTALSRSASSKTMKGDLPPSSSRQLLAGAGGRLADGGGPTSVEPVKAILSTPGWRDQKLAGAPVAGHDC